MDYNIHLAAFSHVFSAVAMGVNMHFGMQEKCPNNGISYFSINDACFQLSILFTFQILRKIADIWTDFKHFRKFSSCCYGVNMDFDMQEKGPNNSKGCFSINGTYLFYFGLI